MIDLKNTNGVAILTINNSKGNMLNSDDLTSLSSIIDSLSLDKSITGLIITGANRSFCTGIDLSTINSSNKFELVNIAFKTLDTIIVQLLSLKKPVIAAINGHAIGAGFLLMLCADYILINPNSKIKYGLPEIKLGLSLDQLMFNLTSTILGYNNSLKLLKSGDLFNNEKLIEYDIVDGCFNSEQLIIESEIILKNITSNCFEAFTYTKYIANRALIENLTSLISDGCYKELTKLYFSK